MSTAMTTRRITGTFGLEVRGGRLGDAIEPSSVLTLLEEHLLVVLRGQFLSHAEQVALNISRGPRGAP